MAASIEKLLSDIKPILQKAGKDVVVVEASETKARFRLEGFCSSCGCGDSYRDGLREMVEGKFPGVKVEFE